MDKVTSETGNNDTVSSKTGCENDRETLCMDQINPCFTGKITVNDRNNVFEVETMMEKSVVSGR